MFDGLFSIGLIQPNPPTHTALLMDDEPLILGKVMWPSIPIFLGFNSKCVLLTKQIFFMRHKINIVEEVTKYFDIHWISQFDNRIYKRGKIHSNGRTVYKWWGCLTKNIYIYYQLTKSYYWEANSSIEEYWIIKRFLCVQYGTSLFQLLLQLYILEQWFILHQPGNRLTYHIDFVDNYVILNRC